MSVHKVPPRRKPVYHKGMKGWIEYHPRTKTWTFKLKYQVTNVFEGESTSEAAAVYEIRAMINLLTGATLPVRSIE